MLRPALLAVSALGALACLPAVAAAQTVTGLYIGAGAGGNILQTEPVIKHTGQAFHYQVGGIGVASVGYGFGNGFRIEVEGSIRHNRVRKLSDRFFNQSFPTAAGGDRYTYAAMVNGLFDLDIRSPYIFPYLGVGVGYAWSRYDGVHAYGVGPDFGFTTTYNGTQGNFAYQGIIGASFPLAPIVGLSLTAEYRFLGTVGTRSYSFASTSNLPNGPLFPKGRFRESDAYNHSVLLGVRYAFNVAPPAPPPVAPTPMPAPEPTRTYLVFFDWDSAALSTRARQIVADAAHATQRTQVTRIEVNGYTDLSGTARYNQALSVRRATAIAAELVRDGVPRGEIATRGFGETNPLVPTAQGVREPQNRRVEIILK